MATLEPPETPPRGLGQHSKSAPALRPFGPDPAAVRWTTGSLDHLLTPPGLGRPRRHRPRRNDSRWLLFNQAFSLGGSFIEEAIFANRGSFVEPDPVGESDESDGEEEEGEEEVLKGGEHATLSGLQAGIALFKALVGPGLLFLPAGFKNSGLVSGLAATGVIGGVTTYCMALLVDAAEQLQARGMQVRSLGDMGALLFGQLGRVGVNATVFAAQCGFCIAYCVFVAENLQAVIYEASGGMVVSHQPTRPCNLTGVWANQQLVYLLILITIPPLIPACWVRQIRYFTFTNALSNVLVLLTVLFMICSLAYTIHQNSPPVPGLFEWKGTLKQVGTAMYAFEGVSMLLPIQRSMRQPEQMKVVLTVTMAVVVALCMLFGGLAFWTYGEKTRSIITLNFGDGHALGGLAPVIAVQISWVLVVMMTFPLQLFPAAMILANSCGLEDRHSGRKWCKNLLRSLLVLCCMAIATGGYSSVDNLVAVIGALGCVPLGVWIPAIFHYKAIEQGGASWQRALDVGIVVFGLVGTVLALAMAVWAWVTTDFQEQVGED